MTTFSEINRDHATSRQERIEWAGYEAANRVAYWTYRIRNESGLSQEQLARLVGTKQPNISSLEAGDLNPTARTIGKLAAALNRDVSALVAPVWKRRGDAGIPFSDVWTGQSQRARYLVSVDTVKPSETPKHNKSGAPKFGRSQAAAQTA